MQAHFTPQQGLPKTSEHDMGIGDRRFTPPIVVTHGSWVGTGGLWSNLQAATAGEAGDAPSPCTNTVDVDHGERQGQVGDLAFGGQRGFLLLSETDIGGRTTDIDRYTAGEASLARYRNGPHDCCGRA